MEFNFNINNLLTDTITRVDCNVNPGRKNANGYDQNQLRTQLMSVIDKMGDASSKAQGLYQTITTGRKLQLSDHLLYLMKDANANNGHGDVVGILKTGPKKLFVYNHHGNVHEMEPVCVLDFYVHESRQRMGCGRKLFDYMLHDQGVHPQHLAIDKPSFKFSQFLNKHYHLRAVVPQVNNFVVFEGFFNNRITDGVGKPKSAVGRPPAYPNRRNDQQQIHNGEDNFRRQNSSYNPRNNGHGPPPRNTPSRNTPVMDHGSRPSSGTSIKTMVLPSPRNNQLEFQRNGQLRPISAAKEEEKDPRIISAQAVRQQGKQIYSRHITSPAGSLPGSRPGSNSRPPLPRLHSGGTGGLGSNGVHINRNNNANYDEPVLKRGVTVTEDYLHNFNLHQEYQGRKGQLKVTPTGVEQPIRNPFLSRQEEQAAKGPWQPPPEQDTWTVFNKPPGYLSLAQRKYTHTKLW